MRHLLRPPSAIVVPVPEADSVVMSRRVRYDPSATKGMPTHVTVLYPFMPSRAIDRAAIAALRDLASRFDTFSFRLARTATFPDVLYLAPDPPDGFVALTDALQQRWHDYQPYEGRHSDIVPHLSVAHGAWPAGLEAELRRELPIDATADEMWLLVPRRGRWSVIEPFALRCNA